IGEFSMNVEGKLVFEPNTERYFKDEWYGFRSTTAKLVEKRVSVLNPPVVHVHDDHVEVLEEEERRSVKVNWIAWTSAAMIAGLMFYFSLFYVSSNGENRSTLNPFTSFFDKMTTGAAPVEAKKVTVPVKRRIVYVVRKPVVEKVDSLSAPIAEPVVKEKPLEVKPEVVVSAVPVPASNKQFYLIAGTFKGNRQANVLLEEMKKKGYSDAVVIEADQYSKKVKVAVEGFEREGDAYRASAKLKKIIGEEGWVYKKR
ncbi:MAG: SPOR domain-containing protein, partial [Dyadobacter sp.]